ncbi:MAG: aldolase/citrate lyase family protein [Proteobacteria bacterium]|nr:aldolase/citrate lyase family protein [Pseudomonadota bacterium]MDA1331120.1 aldolase/citrate lyase family protein [Pseudomonadota bacterium]
MASLINAAKQKLIKSELAIGVGARNVRGIEIACLMKSAGYDWLFIDMEHGPTSIESAASICITSLANGIAPIVRVPQGDLNLGTRCLDAGALGIVMPHVDNAEQAAKMAEAFRFKPLGRRSIAGNYPHFGFISQSALETTTILNEATLLVAMIETPEAIKNVDSIAAVPGIDVLLMGTNDLCLEMGIPGEIDHPQVSTAILKLVAACKRHGKWAGLGGVYEQNLLAKYINQGVKMILAGNDVTLLLDAATAQAQFVKNCEKR